VEEKKHGNMGIYHETDAEEKGLLKGESEGEEKCVMKFTLHMLPRAHYLLKLKGCQG